MQICHDVKKLALSLKLSYTEDLNIPDIVGFQLPSIHPINFLANGNLNLVENRDILLLLNARIITK